MDCQRTLGYVKRHLNKIKNLAHVRKQLRPKGRVVQSPIKGAQSWYFKLFWPRTELPENSSLLQWKKKNTKEIIINHKGTGMVKDGED